MTISEATPIQFWPIIPRSAGATQRLRILFIEPTYGSLNTPTTFNELQNKGGMTYACYCNPMDFNDPMLIQFLSTAGQSYVLNMIRSDDQAYLFNVPIIEISSGLYQLTIPTLGNYLGSGYSSTKNEWGHYQFSIGTAATVNASTYIPNPAFVTATAGWTLSGGSGVDWAYVGAGTVAAVVTVANPNSDVLTRTAAFTDTDNTRTTRIHIYGTAARTGGTPRGYVRFKFYSNGAEVAALQRDCEIEFNQNSNSSLSTAAPVSCKLIIPPTGSSIDNIGISVHMTTNGAGDSITVTMQNADAVIYNDTMDILQKSDCYDLSWNEWRELNGNRNNDTVLIRYSNADDFDSIQYGFSPNPEFNLRIPGVFFGDDNPSEEETHQLSDDTEIRVWSKTERKRKLEVGFVPDFIHRKLKLIFMQDFINVGSVHHIGFTNSDDAGDNAGLDIVLKDSYDKDAGNKRYPLKKASVMLTDKDYIKRNLL